MIIIDCALQISPTCTQTFTASPAYWEGLKQPDGKPFCVPKSCKPCRDCKKQNTPPSMVTVLDDDQHENDGADDDYGDYMYEYCLSMSDTLL